MDPPRDIKTKGYQEASGNGRLKIGDLIGQRKNIHQKHQLGKYFERQEFIFNLLIGCLFNTFSENSM
jgi:hypothetical protein